LNGDQRTANGEPRTANGDHVILSEGGGAAAGRSAQDDHTAVRALRFAVRCSLFALLTWPATAQTVDHVQLFRHSVFDADEASFALLRLVNKLHITTRPYVIRRELLVTPGSPWDSARVAESERNLRALRVFRSVRIDSVRTDSGLVARVVTRDGWSTRPDFRFKSTGGELDYTLALIEDNLLGTATQASILYRDTPDRTSTTFAFRQRRLIAGAVGLSASYSNRSDGERGAVSLGKPFFTLGSRTSWSLFAEGRDERVLRYEGGRLLPVDSTFREYGLVRGDLARAFRRGTDGYLRGGVAVQVRSDEYRHPLATHEIVEGTEAAAGVWLQSRRARYLRTNGYNALTQEEDIDLSTVVHVGAWVHPDGVGPEVWAQTGVRLPNGFLHLSGQAHGLFGSGVELDSGSVSGGATMAWLPSPRHLAVVHAQAGVIRRPLPGSEYDLGLGAGPRGFRQHAFTGDRMFFVSAEYRYGLAPDFLKVVDVGIATFADFGGAWFDGTDPRSGWDAGIGLRLGASRAPDVEANRIDLVYRSGNSREPAGWLLVVAKGFAFGESLRGDR
jgi:hypothetical protein